MDIPSSGNNLSKVLEAEGSGMTDPQGQSRSRMEDVLEDKEVSKGQRAKGLLTVGRGSWASFCIQLAVSKCL